MLLKFNKINFGKNNVIPKSVKIYPNVIIGSNNKFLGNTVIYPNTVIGDNNVFLNNNILGEHPVNSNETKFIKKKFGGLNIGNNNFFHVNNIICSGYDNPTVIGNNNKFLADCHVSHDCQIQDFVYLYPRVFLGGYVSMHSYSGAGAGSFIHQKKIIGGFAFTSMNSSIVKHSFPFYVNIQNKSTRLNLHRISPVYSMGDDQKKSIEEILQKYHQDKGDLKVESYHLPRELSSIITYFISETTKPNF